MVIEVLQNSISNKTVKLAALT